MHDVQDWARGGTWQLQAGRQAFQAHLLGLEAVQPGGRLVQEDEARLSYQLARDGQPLLLPT